MDHVRTYFVTLIVLAATGCGNSETGGGDAERVESTLTCRGYSEASVAERKEFWRRELGAASREVTNEELAFLAHHPFFSSAASSAAAANLRCDTDAFSAVAYRLLSSRSLEDQRSQPEPPSSAPAIPERCRRIPMNTTAYTMCINAPGFSDSP